MNTNLVSEKSNSEASLKLLMYTAMPATDSAWQAGFEAARLNSSLDDNPFDNNDKEYQFWESGWWAGFYDEDYLTNDMINSLDYYRADYMYTLNQDNDESLQESHSLNSGSQVRSPRFNTLSNLSLKKLLISTTLLLISIIGVGVLLME